MSEILKGNAYWPGVDQVFSCEYSVEHGTAPGAARLVIPFDSFNKAERTGNLTFTDGVRTRTLSDCMVYRGSLVDADSGKGIELTILDRRWKWKYGTFSARYNLRDDRGIIIGNPVSPSQIAEDILKAMGEQNYSIDLPAGLSQSETPFFDFAESRFDHALEELAGKFQRVVVFQPWANRVIIAKPGDGAELPALDVSDLQVSLEPSEIPSSITVLGAPIVYQAVFKLAPAARELDGSIVPLDSVSYRPVGGWGLSRNRAFRDIVTPAQFVSNGLTFATATRDEIVNLAASCVWKVFRFTAADPLDNSRPLRIPGLELDAPDVQVTDPYQLDFLDVNVYADTRDAKAKPFNMPLNVWGSVYKGAIPFFNPWKSNDLTIPTDVFRGISFSVDNARKILISDRYLYAVNASDPANPFAYAPTLYCKCSVNVRDKNGKLIRYSKNQFVSNANNTKPAVIVREDIVRVRMAEFDTSTLAVKTQSDNGEACDQIAGYYLDSELKRLENKDTKTANYPGFIPIDPDGAIRQISWTVGGKRPPSTVASLNREHRFWVPSFEQRLFQQRLKAFIDRPIPFINANSRNASGQGGIAIEIGAGSAEAV